MKKILIIFMAALLLFTSGCGKNSKQGAIAANNGIKNENNAINIYCDKPDSLCPILSRNTTVVQMLNAVYDGLVTIDDAFVAQPCLAENWSVSPEGKKWTFNLRSGVKWHDGSGFNAGDVVYTVEQIKKNPDSIYAYNVSGISSITAVGELSVEIEVVSPWLNFINLLHFPIIKSGAEEIDAAAYRPVGTGPYVFEDRGETSAYYLKANENWWGGSVKGQYVTVKILPDNNTALHSFSSGTIDITTANNMNWSRFVDPNTSSYQTVKGTEFCFLGMNNQSGALQFAEVRKAVSLCINRDEIVNELMMGHATAANLPVRNEWAVCGGKTFDTARDVETAKNLLAENQWEHNGSVYRKTVEDVAYGTEFRILYNKDNEIREAIAREIEMNLEEAGFGVSLESVSYEDYMTQISSGEYDLFVGSTVLSPDLGFSFFIGSGNVFGFNNEEMSQIMFDAGVKHPASAAATYGTILSKLDELMPVAGLFFENGTLVFSNRLEGTLAPNVFDVYRNLEYIRKGVVSN